MPLQNASIAVENTWNEDGLTFKELIRQEYAGNNCVFSAGEVEGYPIDTLYLMLEKDDTPRTLLLLRPDEVAAIAWCMTGVLWSVENARLDEEKAPS